MPQLEAGALLRAGLLEGVSIVVAATARAPVAEAVEESCAGLGAAVRPWRVDAEDWQEEGEAAGARAAPATAGDADLLAVDAASVFAPAGAGGDGPRLCLEVSWGGTKAGAGRAVLAGEAGSEGRGGRLRVIR